MIGRLHRMTKADACKKAAELITEFDLKRP